MNRREAEQLLRAVRETRAAGEPAALATVVAVKGSAYRREGTQMLVRRDRTYECALSGGCLEPAVADAAVRVIDTGVPALVRYDLTDDSVWGLGLGCTGAVDIYIERVEDDEATNAWLAVLERGEAAVEVLSLSGSSGRLVVREGAVVGSLNERDLTNHVIARARERLRARDAHSSAESIAGAELQICISSILNQYPVSSPATLRCIRSSSRSANAPT